MDAYDENIVPDSDPVYDRVARVANTILKCNKDLEQLHGKDWTITVVKDETKNAFVLPVSGVFTYLLALHVFYKVINTSTCYVIVVQDCNYTIHQS